jgi:hypothetical protein
MTCERKPIPKLDDIVLVRMQVTCSHAGYLHLHPYTQGLPMSDQMIEVKDNAACIVKVEERPLVPGDMVRSRYGGTTNPMRVVSVAGAGKYVWAEKTGPMHPDDCPYATYNVKDLQRAT